MSSIRRIPLSIFLIYAAAALSSLSGFTFALEVGDCICREGIIMDRFCIRRKRLLDNSSAKTLTNPEKHSMHCLLDIPMCVNSGFTVLGDPADGETEYTVAAQLDQDGTDLLYDFAAARGKENTCDDCTGDLGEWERGFRAAVVGTVENVGDLTSSDPLDRSPSIKVTDIFDSSVGCANACSASGDDDDDDDDDDSVSGNTVVTGNSVVDCNALQSTVMLNSSPMVTLEYVVNVPNTQTNYQFTPEQVAAGGVLTAKLTYQGNGYVALASSTNGLMPNSEAVICLPGSASPTVSKYFLGDRNAAAVTSVTNQTLSNTTVTQSGGTTTCTFTKLLNEPGEIAIVPNQLNTMLWAVGNGNTIAYHRARGRVDVNLQQCVAGTRRYLRENKQR